MFVKHLKLHNYKNLNIDKQFSRGVNVIIAPNGTGKTNLLESINYLATGSSFRNIPDSEVFPYDEEIEYSAIVGNIAREEKEGSDELKIVWRLKNRNEGKFIKTYFHNNKKTNLNKFKHMISCHVHAPDTMDMVTGTASVRRDFIDDSIKLIRPGYKGLLKNYWRVVRSRSSLLENFRGSESELLEQLQFWDKKLVDMSLEIAEERINFLETLMPIANEAATEIYHLEGVNLGFELDSKYIEIEAASETNFKKTTSRRNLEGKLEAGFEKERRAMRTLYGAHRDDLIFTLKGKHLRYAASRGQQRLFSLVIHIGLIQLIEAQSQTKLIVLLDDVLSELDTEHKQNTCKFFHEFSMKESRQIFMTSADPHDFGDKFLQSSGIDILEID